MPKARVKFKCIKISYVTKTGKRVTYWRKVQILKSGKLKFVSGECTAAMKKTKTKTKKKTKTKRKKKTKTKRKKKRKKRSS